MSAAHADMTKSALSEHLVLGLTLSFPFPPPGLVLFLMLFELRARRIAFDMVKFGSLNVDLDLALGLEAESVEAKDATEGALERGGVGDWATTGGDGGDWVDMDEWRDRWAESTLMWDGARDSVRLPLRGRVEWGCVE
jgi:hypothetical protein